MSFEWGKIVKSINWTLVFNLINFGILLLLLRWLLFKPAVEYLDRRRELIASRMERARESEEAAARLSEERASALGHAQEQAQRMLEEATTRGEEIVGEAKAAARQEAERIVEVGRRQLEQERDAMIGELRSAYAEIAVLGASQVLKREISGEDHERFLDELLAGLDEEALKTS
ncbi:MAG: F0F1 ATP synthase subunit B [Candidatus Bipolaricaulota bacterium]|nr:MAG: F0F1 ATP synthase subunit B [Candidatus Bipolaricaulota bacterium]